MASLEDVVLALQLHFSEIGSLLQLQAGYTTKLSMSGPMHFWVSVRSIQFCIWKTWQLGLHYNFVLSELEQRLHHSTDQAVNSSSNRAGARFAACYPQPDQIKSGCGRTLQHPLSKKNSFAITAWPCHSDDPFLLLTGLDSTSAFAAPSL